MRIHKPLLALLMLPVLAFSLLVLASPVMAQADLEASVPVVSEPEVSKPAVSVPEVDVTDLESESEREPVTGGAGALTPEGNMALVDDIHSQSDTEKQFIVVQSRSGHYFYIIIDHADEGENIVHFLNQVDEADLLALIEEEEQAPAVCSCTTKCEAGAVDTSCEVCAVNMAACVGPEPEPEEPETPDEPESLVEPAKKSGNTLMIVLVLVVLSGGGAVAYLKFFKNKPNTKGSTDLDDYDYGDEDQEDDDEDEDNEYEDDDYDEYEDGEYDLNDILNEEREAE